MAERFVRTARLTIVNEVRLLLRDPVSLLMLLVAPVVIMTVAGYSLGALYGARPRAATVPIVDHDGGAIAGELMAAVSPDAPLRLVGATDLAAVRRRLGRHDAAPLAIEVPAGTHDRLASGRSATLVLWIDPARRLEVNALELALSEVQRRAAAAGRDRARRQLVAHVRELRHTLVHFERAVAREHRHLQGTLDDATRAVADAVRARAGAAVEQSRRDLEAAIRRADSAARAELAGRQAALARVMARLRALEEARAAFEQWLAALRTKAGRHAAGIPSPPAFPAPPADADLALLERPIVPIAAVAPALPSAEDVGARVAAAADAAARRMPVPALRVDGLAGGLRARLGSDVPRLPGPLDAVERPAVDGTPVRVNAFDQYVPGFGVTFLLIGMMLGISLTLFDERDWGTLERVCAGGASLGGILVGKVLARAAVGVAQMLVLFGVGWALFDVALGRAPAALLLPMAGMSFAAAALGLVVPALAPAHDSVMPLGTMTSLALAAIGGCWWPLDFEPAWMRALARWLPTTWTMQAYNDLMIRGAPPSAALVPFLATAGIGVVVMAVGIAAGLEGRGTRRR